MKPLRLQFFESASDEEIEEVREAVRLMSRDDLETHLRSWRFWARDEQVSPVGNWTKWLYLAGRGSGKTRSGAEWIREEVRNGARLLALIAPTAADARDVMIRGPSGLLACSFAGDQDFDGNPVGVPLYQPSKRLLTWANGATALVFSAEEPERLRGPQFERIWADELAAWQYAQEAWDMAMFGLRLGRNPKVMITTTPRPIPLVKMLLKEFRERDPSTVVTTGTSYANRANLAPAFFSTITKRYEGTRLGRQELNAEVLEDIPGALWTRAMIDKNRISMADLPELVRVVVAVDPSGASGEEDSANDIGIVAAGKGADGKAYVLRDATLLGSPMQWGRRVSQVYSDLGANRVVAERNFGGAMVEHVIRTENPNISYKEVTASRGKAVRAEPIAALSEQNRVKFVGSFPDLEEELMQFGPEGYMGDSSPNRADAFVWAINELMLGSSTYTLAHVYS